MSSGKLSINLGAICANWQALDALSGGTCETAAVIKADAYGLGAKQVGPALARAGARTFFVATAEEGAALRMAVGSDPRIFVFSGHMSGDTALLSQARLIPLLNDAAQCARHHTALPDHPYGIQLDTGMSRLGVAQQDWPDVQASQGGTRPALIMSHLACADEPDHEMNARQLARFRAMTDGIQTPRSLGATGGILLGPQYHFDLTRPGVGLYGGKPFAQAQSVVQLDLPVVQTRRIAKGASVGYANSWIAPRPSRIATVASGYADGILRSLSDKLTLWHGQIAVPVVGRVSMDLLTADVTDLNELPEMLTLLGPKQGVDELATCAGTIGYEILTSLGPRYARHWAVHA